VEDSDLRKYQINPERAARAVPPTTSFLVQESIRDFNRY
jgi:hypothetical protein